MCCTRLAQNTGRKSRQKSPSGHHLRTLSGYIFAIEARIDNRKNLLSSNMSSRCPHNMVNFGPLAAEIVSLVWGTPKFQPVSRLGSITARHVVVGVSQTLRPWIEGATYFRQGDHHVGHWPTFLVILDIHLYGCRYHLINVYVPNNHAERIPWFTKLECRPVVFLGGTTWKYHQRNPLIHFDY